MLAVAFSVSASAEEVDYAEKPKIIAKNVLYDSYLRLLFAVECEGVAPEQMEMLFWKEMPDSVTDTPAYIDSSSFSATAGDGRELSCIFESYGIAPKDAPDYVYAAARIKDTDVYSDIVRYSVIEYVYERLYTDEITAIQDRFYRSIVEFTESAQFTLDHDIANTATAYGYVSVSGGNAEDGYGSGTYKIGSTLTLTATDAEAFTAWVDEKGDTVSTEPKLTVTVGEGYKSYSALTGCVISVINGTQDDEDGRYSPGDTATLRAPISKTEGGEEYSFLGWYGSEGELAFASATASFTVTESESYTAIYGKAAEENEIFDFEDGKAPAVSSKPVTESSYTESDEAAVTKTDGMSGGCLQYGGIKLEAAKGGSYINNRFEVTASEAKAAVLGFELKLEEQDLNFTDSGYIGDGKYNRLNDFTTSKTDTKIYTAGLYFGEELAFELCIRVEAEGGEVTGYTLTDSTGEVVYTPSPLLLGVAYRIEIELSADENGDGWGECGIYLNGGLLAKAEYPAATASGVVTAVFGATKNTVGYIYLDDISYREIK